MKLTFQIQLRSGSEVKDPEPQKLVIAGWNGEMGWHLALKLLAYLVFFEMRPKIEVGIGWHYKPDLVSLDDRGNVELWVDCGNIAVRKIDRVATKVGTDGRFFIFKRHSSETRLLLRALRGKIKRPERLTLVCFDDEFVDHLTELLDGTNELRVDRSAESLRLHLKNRHGEQVLESRIHRFSLTDSIK